MNEQTQAKLLEAFLLALRHDATAPAPPELDPALVTFARRLAQDRTPAAPPGARERVWQRALGQHAAQSPRPGLNGHLAGRNHIEQEMNRMIATGTLNRAISKPLSGWRVTPPLTLIAALAVVTLATLLILNRPPSGPNNDDEPLSLGLSMQQEETSTPLPLATLTVTPTLTITPSPAFTITSTPIPIQNLTPFPPTVAPPGEAQLIPLMPSYVPGDPIAVATVVPGAMPPFNIAQPMPGIPTVLDPANVIAIELGPVIRNAITVAAPFAAFEFRAPADGPVVVQVESSAIPDLTISHVILAAGGGGGGGGGDGMGRQPGLPTQTSAILSSVRRGDTVTIFVSSSSGQYQGDFNLSVRQIEAVEIAYGDSVEGTIDGETMLGYYTFEASAGDIVTIRAVGVDDYDTTIDLKFPDGQILYDDDGGPGYSSELYRQLLTTGGTYSILVQSAVPAGGRYELTLDHEQPPSLDDGPQVAAFTGKTDLGLTFEGRAGETVQLDVRAVEGAQIELTALSLHVLQDGVLLSVFDRNFGTGQIITGGAALVSGNVTIPGDGPVEVRVIAVPTHDTMHGDALEVSLTRPD